jgi:hypothetical protein
MAFPVGDAQPWGKRSLGSLWDYANFCRRNSLAVTINSPDELKAKKLAFTVRNNRVFLARFLKMRVLNFLKNQIEEKLYWDQ